MANARRSTKKTTRKSARKKTGSPTTDTQDQKAPEPDSPKPEGDIKVSDGGSKLSPRDEELMEKGQTEFILLIQGGKLHSIRYDGSPQTLGVFLKSLEMAKTELTNMALREGMKLKL